MPSFVSSGIPLAYDRYGAGKPILLIHGFGSSGKVNWVDTGWVETLVHAGFEAITIDNRGHGNSRKLYDASLYFAHAMAGDAINLLNHLGLTEVPMLGYSMGARIAAFVALQHPERVTCSIWGGMGLNLVTGLEDSERIIAALTAESLGEVKDPVGRTFRIFAESTGADRAALAACMVTSREPMAAVDVRRIDIPVLIANGSADEMAGPAAPLAAILPHAESITIERRDHMRATGDPAFKRAVVSFLARHE